MVPHAGGEGQPDFERAKRAIAADNTVAALAALEKALRLEENPEWYSYLGYCIAKERGLVSRGVELCRASLEHEPDNPDHYLNLGRVLLLSGDNAGALRVFREGMGRGGNDELAEQLNAFSMRKRLIVPFLSRNNPVNKFLGLILSRIGLR